MADFFVDHLGNFFVDHLANFFTTGDMVPKPAFAASIDAALYAVVAAADTPRFASSTSDSARYLAVIGASVMATYQLATLARLPVSFTQIGGGAVDPTDVKLFVSPPNGTVVTYTSGGSQIQKSTTGNYYYDLMVDQIGVWTYNFQGIGAAPVTTGDKTLSCVNTIFEDEIV